MNENRTIEIHDQYAKLIFTEGYDDPVLKDLAIQYINELPKAARKGQERDYIAACETKLEAFRAAVRDYNLGINQGIIDKNAQLRHEDSELSADLRAAQTQHVVVQTGNAVIGQVNKHTDESNAEQTTQINANTNRVGNSVVRRVNAHTTAEVNRGVSEINAHTDEVGEKVIHDVTQNTSAMLGVDAEGYTVKEGEERRVLANGNEITDKDNVVAQVNAHTTEEHEKTRLQQQQQGVLNSKRQALADMLGHEDRENFGVYRDVTVKWLGSSADRVMAATDLTFKEKEQALDELTRMVDEESVISDGDKDAFEAKYFYRTEERPHI